MPGPGGGTHQTTPPPSGSEDEVPTSGCESGHHLDAHGVRLTSSSLHVTVCCNTHRYGCMCCIASVMYMGVCVCVWPRGQQALRCIVTRPHAVWSHEDLGKWGSYTTNSIRYPLCLIPHLPILYTYKHTIIHVYCATSLENRATRRGHATIQRMAQPCYVDTAAPTFSTPLRYGGPLCPRYVATPSARRPGRRLQCCHTPCGQRCAGR